MEKQEYVIAFGYGIKEKHFFNRYGDIRVLIAHFKKDGTYYTSTIKSNGGGVAKHYVRFLTEEDAQRYIDEKLGSGYTYFKAKESRLLKLLDSKYNMYVGGVTAPVGVQPAEYDKNGDLITPRISSDNIDKDISKIVNSLIDKKYYVNSSKFDDQVTEFFFSDLDIDTGLHGFEVGRFIYIKNIIPNGDGINVDLDIDVRCYYSEFRETTTQVRLNKVLYDEDFRDQIRSLITQTPKDYYLPFNIFVKYTDLKDSIGYMWDREDKYPQFKSVIAKIIGERAVESILKLKPGSTNYQNVINLRSEIRDITTKLISIVKDYTKTEVFMEAYKDKDVGGVTTSTDIHSTRYDKKGDLITPGLNADDIDKYICKILTWSIGQEYYFHLESYFSESEVDKIIEFFLSGLDIDTDWKCKFQLCAPFYIKNITPDDDGINVDLLLKVYFPYKYFKETTTKMEMGTILDDPDENFNPRVNSIRDVVDKFYDLPLNIFINYTDLKNSIIDLWNSDDSGSNYTQFKFIIVRLIGYTAVKSILYLEPGSANYQNVIDLRTKVRDKTLEIISVIRDYVKTEFFIESYKDKTVQDILHDLYEGKIK